MIAPVNDNRHMISHDANMICGHLNKLQAYMNVGENFPPLLQVEYVYSRTSLEMEETLDCDQTRFLDELYCKMTRLLTLKLFKFFHFCSSLSENLVCLWSQFSLQVT